MDVAATSEESARRLSIGFNNFAHAVDHYVMLIFPTVVIGLEAVYGRQGSWSRLYDWNAVREWQSSTLLPDTAPAFAPGRGAGLDGFEQERGLLVDASGDGAVRLDVER